MKHLWNPPTFSTHACLFLMALMSFFVSHGYAQKSALMDSLNLQLRTTNDEVLEVKLYNELAWQYKNTDFTKSLAFAQQGLALATKLNYLEGKATAHNRMASVLRKKANYDSALWHYQEALHIEDALHHNYGIGRAKNGIALIYKSKRQYYKAISVYKHSLTIFNQLEKWEAALQVANNLANCYLKVGNYDEAIALYLNNLAFYEAKNQLKPLGETHLNLSTFYLEAKNKEKALFHAKKALVLYQSLNLPLYILNSQINLGLVHNLMQHFDNAIFQFNEALVLSKELDVLGHTQEIYNHLGNVYRRQKAYEKSLEAFGQCLALNPSKEIQAWVYHNSGLAFLQLKQVKNAQQAFTKSLDLAFQTQDLFTSLNVLKDLAGLHLSQQEYQRAAQYNERYIALSDSLYASYQKSINFKEAFEVELTQKQVLEKDKQVQQARILQFEAESLQQATLIYSLSAGMVFMVLLYAISLRSHRAQRKVLLAEKQLLIKEQEVEDLLRHQEVSTFGAMLEGQESERKRIAQDLHDRLGGTLSMVKLHFKSMDKAIENLKMINTEQYHLASQLLDDACEEVRKVAHNMTSGTLSKFGLFAAVQDLKTKIEAAHLIEIELIEIGLAEVRLDAKIEVGVYHIVQELISNTLKHAEATDLSIQLFKKEQVLQIIVEDNGKGFNTEEAAYQQGMGMKNIEARVQKLKGDFVIDTMVGRGTIFILDIPLPE